MWALVFIYMMGADSFALTHSSYESLSDCFMAREALGSELTGVVGSFNRGTQALCIEHDYDY